jgi:hypothetical protein
MAITCTIKSIFGMKIIKDALEKEGLIKEYKETARDSLFIRQKE